MEIELRGRGNCVWDKNDLQQLGAGGFLYTLDESSLDHDPGSNRHLIWEMKKRFHIAAIIFGIIGFLSIAIGVQYRKTYPYGWSHCCIIAMSFSLDQYAEEHGGHFPTGEASPEASLSLLYRSNYVDANTMRGMTISEKIVRRIFKGGGLLCPDTCGWHYTDGLTLADDQQIAILYCKQPLGHNGEKTMDRAREVAFVGGYIEPISGDKWQSFVQEQNELLAKRSDRAKSGKPLVDAIIDLPDGRQVESVDAPTQLKSRTLE
jgi:hypothetical protein